MNKKDIVSDFLAGLSVSFAAIALGAAFGVMSGRGAFAGMIAAGVIPIITGIFGGTRLSVSGPTGPMTAVSSVVIAFAYDSFENKALAEQFITLVFILTAVGLLITGLLRTGRFIHYVPRVVLLGFMSGIALVIFVDQTKTLFGVGGKTAPAGGVAANLTLAIGTFILILILPYILNKLKAPKSVTRFVPFTLTGIILMTVLTSVLSLGVGKIDLGFSMDSFSDLVAHIANYLPSSDILTSTYILQAMPYALELVLLGYLDSLLTALIMDHLTKEKSNMNQELIGQGLSNAMAAICQGIPGAQATIRSVLLFKEGAKTRFSVVVAGVIVLLGFLAFKDYVTLVTAAVFIGVLFKAALDVFEKEFLEVYFKRRWFKFRNRNFQLVFVVYTMLVTAFVDLNVAVFSATALFYILRKPLRFADVEPDFINEDEFLKRPESEQKELEMVS
jgi:SulP family sulfate permease